MNRKAKKTFAFPQSSRSDARKNSKVFMIAIIRIWEIALSLDHFPLSIQTAIAISEIPIKMVNNLEWSVSKILPTISWCRGTRLSTLQKSPFAIQTVAMKYLISRYFDLASM